MTRPRAPGEERLQRPDEPEKDVASGTRTLVVGAYLSRRRRSGAGKGFADRRDVEMSVGDLAITPRISLVAVCCSKDSFSSRNSRTFSIAITA